MNYSELEQEGKRLSQQYLDDLENATPMQITEANRITELHVNEYGNSFAKILHNIIN